MTTHPNRRASSTTSDLVHNHDEDYPVFLAEFINSFGSTLASATAVFTTNAEGLYNAYLNNLPSEKQVHTCHACRRFLEQYGSLVCVEDDGQLTPLVPKVSDEIPEFYHASVAAMHTTVKRARITGVFKTKERTWGLPQTGQWSHFAIKQVPLQHVHIDLLLTPFQYIAKKAENYKMVAQVLAEYKPNIVTEALRMFETDALNRSEKFVGPVRWLNALHNRPKGRLGENILWQAVATAPDGFCHVRGGMTGMLLDDIEMGKPFENIRRNFASRTGATLYQVAQALPSAGNIKAAEELISKLGLAPSLERRFAKFEELDLLWKPTVVEKPAAEGIFGHLKTKVTEPEPMQLPAQTMTWDKFNRMVLPTAEQMMLAVPSAGFFIGLTTAVDPDAPPILKWNHPVAWFVYPQGSTAVQWSLNPGWCDVTGITLLPNMWGDQPQPQFGEGAVFVLKGAIEKVHSSNSLFPEIMRGDLHEIRATITEYSRKATLHGREEATACGYDLRKGSQTPVTVKVLCRGAWNHYKIDRWD